LKKYWRLSNFVHCLKYLPEVERLFGGFGHDGFTMNFSEVNGKPKNHSPRKKPEAGAASGDRASAISAISATSQS
jgi:hypothetical protein